MRVLDEKSVARGLGFSHLFNLYEGVFAVSRLDLMLDSPMAVRPCQNRTRGPTTTGADAARHASRYRGPLDGESVYLYAADCVLV